MTKVQVLKHKVVQLLRYLVKINVMKYLLHFIWFGQMSAFQFARYAIIISCKICNLRCLIRSLCVLFAGCFTCMEDYSCKYP